MRPRSAWHRWFPRPVRDYLGGVTVLAAIGFTIARDSGESNQAPGCLEILRHAVCAAKSIRVEELQDHIDDPGHVLERTKKAVDG